MNDQLHPLLSLIDDEGWNKLGRWSRDLSVCFSPRERQVERSLCGSSMRCNPAYHTHLCTAFMELQALKIQEAAGLCSVCGAVWIYVRWFEFYTINLHGNTWLRPSFWVMFIGSAHTTRYKSRPDLVVQGILYMYDSMLLKLLGKQLLCVAFCGLHNLVQCSVCQLHVRSLSLFCSEWRIVSPWKRERKKQATT